MRYAMSLIRHVRFAVPLSFRECGRFPWKSAAGETRHPTRKPRLNPATVFGDRRLQSRFVIYSYGDCARTIRRTAKEECGPDAGFFFLWSLFDQVRRRRAGADDGIHVRHGKMDNVKQRRSLNRSLRRIRRMKTRLCERRIKCKSGEFPRRREDLETPGDVPAVCGQGVRRAN